MSSVNEIKILMTQTRIAECSGISQQHISLAFRGDRQPSLETATKLEECTGICREAWLLPERHWNPYVPFADAESCTKCDRRWIRQEWLMTRIYDYLEQNPTREGLQVCVEAIKEFYRAPEELVYSFGRLRCSRGRRGRRAAAT